MQFVPMRLIVNGQEYYYNGWRIIKPPVTAPITKDQLEQRRAQTRSVAVITTDRTKATLWQILPGWRVWQDVQAQVENGEYILI